MNDSKIDKLKEEGIKQSNELMNSYQEKDKFKRDNLEIPPKEIDELLNKINRLRNIFKETNLDNKEEMAYKSDEEFFDSDRLSEISREDFSIIEPIYKELIESTNALQKLLKESDSSFNDKLVVEEDIKEELSDLDNKISHEVVKKLDTTLDELRKKESALEYFTISLLGRTKAGKSTLHTVLTGEGKEEIGVGKQRTTRYNRVYQWGKLRLIDTPGIGAAEEEGREDEKIAEGIIGESDIICIVVSDDSVQKYVFDLAEKIVKRNKPVVILLNHKDDIIHPIKYKLFKRNPNKWMAEDRTNGVYGHIERINDYATKNNYEDMISSYPLFLLPAILALDEKYSSDKNLLIQSSNINSFKDGIKNDIKDVGVLLRSQTLLDDSRAVFSGIESILDGNINSLSRTYDEIKKGKNQALKKVKRSQKRLIKNIEFILYESYRNLSDEYALEFAEKNYDIKNINSRWEKYLKDIEFSSNIERKLQVQYEEFIKDIKEVLVDTLEDLNIGIENNIYARSGNNNFLNIDFKKTTRFLSGITSIAGAIIIGLTGLSIPGIIVTGIGAVGSFLSGLFKSKAEKRRESIDELYSNLRNSIEKNKEKEIKKITKEFNKISKKTIKNIEKEFELISKDIKNIIDSSKKSLQVCYKLIALLDKYYSWRILNYLLDYDIEKSEIDNVILKVDRKFGEYININVNLDSSINYEENNLIREKIKINNI